MTKRKGWMPERLPAGVSDGPRPPSSSQASSFPAGVQLPSNADKLPVPQFMKRQRPDWMENMSKASSSSLPDAGASSSSSWPSLGQPLPSAAAYDDPELMAAHSYRNSPYPSGGQTELTLDPQRLTHMVYGRPVGLLVLTHHNAPPYEFDSYLAARFAPLLPTFVLGPTGKTLDTSGNAAYAIFHLWSFDHRHFLSKHFIKHNIFYWPSFRVTPE
jgi:hypothetical protein